MTIQEEIAQLEAQLQTTADLKVQAEIILKILHNHKKSGGKDEKLYDEKLLQIANEIDSPEHEAWGYYYKGYKKDMNGNYADALEETAKAIKIFSEINNQKGLARSYTATGGAYFFQSHFAESLTNYSAALKIYEETGDKGGMAHAYNNIGKIYLDQGKPSESLDYQLKALQIFEETSDKPGLATSYNNIATILGQQENYPEALSNLLTALKIAEEIGNKLYISGLYSNIATVYLYQDKYDDALSNYYAALKLQQEPGNKSAIASTYNNIGNVLGKQLYYSEALTNFQAALSLSEEIGDKQGVALASYNLGSLYTLMKDYAKAGQYLTIGLKLAEESGKKVRIKGALKVLYELYKEKGEGMLALEYHERFIALEKELQNEETSKKIASLQFGYQIEKKEQEVIFERNKKESLQVAYDLLDKEKQRSESLLLNILPSEVAEELKEKGSADAKLFEDVTVLFTDFKDFTKHSERMSPQDLVNELHACFKGFDEIISNYNIEKIKTVGDAYLAVSGLPLANSLHATDIVKAALEIRDFMIRRKSQTETFEVRIGLHSGRVVAGIVGVKKFAYDIWGDTVNTAARMEQNGEAGKVNISQVTYELVKDKFKCDYRGELEAKNKGRLQMYFVE